MGWTDARENARELALVLALDGVCWRLIPSRAICASGDHQSVDNLGTLSSTVTLRLHRTIWYSVVWCFSESLCSLSSSSVVSFCAPFVYFQDVLSYG